MHMEETQKGMLDIMATELPEAIQKQFDEQQARDVLVAMLWPAGDVLPRAYL